MKKYHYYSFSFSYSEGNKTTTASVYIGYDHKFVSMPQIISAKKGAEINEEAVLISCCYLGKMTEDEVKTGITRRCTWIRKAASVMNILKRIYFYFHPMPFCRKCMSCGKRIKRGEVESLFDPVTDEWLGVKKAIHWSCYAKIYNKRMQTAARL